MKKAEEKMLVARAASCGPGLRALRIEKPRMSLRAVAAQVLVHYTHLSRIERGLGGASMETLRGLAGCYGFGSGAKAMIACAERMQTKKRAKKARGDKP